MYDIIAAALISRLAFTARSWSVCSAAVVSGSFFPSGESAAAATPTLLRFLLFPASSGRRFTC